MRFLVGTIVGSICCCCGKSSGERGRRERAREGEGTEAPVGGGDERADGARSWNGREAAIVARLRAGILVGDDEERAQTDPPTRSSPPCAAPPLWGRGWGREMGVIVFRDG